MQDQFSTISKGESPNIAPTIAVGHLSKHTTHSLQVGVQAQMVEAAKLADYIEAPINRVLTVRTAGMLMTGEGGIFRNGTQPEVIRDLLDKMLRWLKHRSIPIAFIWVREYCSYHQEHLHIGYHMPAEFDAEFASQLTKWFDENIGKKDGHKGTIFMSEMRSWNIRGCIRGNTTGTSIAAYLGKSELSKITTAWGKVKINKRKPVQRKDDTGFGPIEGTVKHHYRWGTSYDIGRTQRDRHDFNVWIAPQRPKPQRRGLNERRTSP